MDLTFEEYIDFVNHLFLERLVDDDFWKEVFQKSSESVQSVDAMTIIE
jgi:hypothetical protein